MKKDNTKQFYKLIHDAQIFESSDRIFVFIHLDICYTCNLMTKAPKFASPKIINELLKICGYGNAI